MSQRENMGCKNKPLPDGWRWVKLMEVCNQDKKIIEPGSDEAGSLMYFSLEDVKAETGRILKKPVDLIDGEGKSTTFYFDNRHVLYGKLRPYLNKVAVPIEAGRCTTEIIPLLPFGDVDREFLAWLLRRQETVEFAMQGKTGSRMPRADMDSLLGLKVPLPPIAEQKRIAGLLRDKMVTVEKARKAAHARLEAIKNLPASLLRQVFPLSGQPLPAGWQWVKLKNTATLLPSRSIASDGNSHVQAVTTACLTESGFNPDGVKPARMKSWEVRDCLITSGEVLIARSNTPELVGRACLYDGNPEGVVASDLTIRIKAANNLLPSFLSRYLSSLFISSYWRDLAGGASGSMKKITRTQVLDLSVPLPPIPEQQRISQVLCEQMAEVDKARLAVETELQTINALPSALLRQALNGEI
jgi:type I restriction enzyme, S subunit